MTQTRITYSAPRNNIETKFLKHAPRSGGANNNNDDSSVNNEC